MKVIIVGAHPEAKELINRISSGWNISVVDIDQEILRNFSTNRQIEKIQGDGTSNLVLKKAGIEQANAVITLTKNDEVNLEVLKLAKQNNILRISSIVNNVSNLDEYKNKFTDQNNVPRPGHWSGFLLSPNKIEFWKDVEGRLHQRLEYSKVSNSWERQILYP